MRLDPPPILTACLSCGWVHGFPWQCPEPPAKDIRVFRVSKSNTLLVVPNDWSTLSNGTVDGVPTGRHRYVGEQRFVFVLLNVTDGHGNLVSYDLEANVGGRFADLSGNGLHAWRSGEPAPARFGLGARLDGTANTYVYAADDPKLDYIGYDMTVAFWVRPGEDYGGGTTTGWRWSTGREGLWRLGYYEDMGTSFHGLRFEVKDTDGGLHSVQASYPLRAGRWYHLAAVMESVDIETVHDTDLRLYVNGEKIESEWFETQFSAMDGATPLRIGHDSAGGGRFKGLADEFRLYTVALSDDSVRGLTWFLAAKNGVVIPRGVFFDSKLFGALNGTWSDTSPLAGATINGNTNNGSAHLNARVIQMVITRNATLAQAWKILDLAVTNTTAKVTAFALPVSDEFYTLGFAKEVRDLVPNAVVENSGNHSAPPPSPTMWELFWNAIAGLAGAIWNAVVAVAMFIVNVVTWLVNVAVGLVIGLVTGDWTYFQENVIEPLQEAWNAFMSWIAGFLGALLSSALSFFLDPLRDVVASYAPHVLYALRGASEDAAAGRDYGHWTSAFEAAFFGPLFWIVTGVAIILKVLIILLTYIPPFLGALISMVSSILVGSILAALLLSNPGNAGPREGGSTTKQLADATVSELEKQYQPGGSPSAYCNLAFNAGAGLVSLAGFWALMLLLGVSDVSGTVAGITAFVLAALSMFFSFWAAGMGHLPDWGLLNAVSLFLALASLLFSAVALRGLEPSARPYAVITTGMGVVAVALSLGSTFAC